MGSLKDKGRNLCLEAEDVGEILNEYFVSVFAQEKGMENSENNVKHANMLGHFEIKKEVLLGLLKSIKEVTKVIDESRSVDVVYMEFSKTFDKVPHGRLIQKLKMHGIH
eukprot:g23288.t1